MFKPGQLLLLGIIILSFSCKNDHSYPYAIKDLRKSLQPHLIKIVEKGIVMEYDSSLRNMATDKDLIKLSQSEHPVLRASAFKEILNRKSFNHFDILMNSLDDTASVLIDEGEFGISHWTVSDDLVFWSTWKTQEAKDKTISKILTEHNYLRSAYTVLARINAQEKYYPFIKDMATRPRRFGQDGYELAFGDIEYALYGLAKFKKKEDIKIIKPLLIKYAWQLSSISFRLMKEYPDTAYMDVFDAYHRMQFYEFSGIRRNGFSGFRADRADPEDFINALAVQQNARSARLFDTLLKYLHLMPCMPDRENIRDTVVMAIWKHPVAAYAELRERIKTRAEIILRERTAREVDWPDELFDTTRDKLVDTTIQGIPWYW